MRFHYEVIAKHFNNYNLIYSDTEGLTCFLLSPGEFSPHVGCLSSESLKQTSFVNQTPFGENMVELIHSTGVKCEVWCQTCKMCQKKVRIQDPRLKI